MNTADPAKRSSSTLALAVALIVMCVACEAARAAQPRTLLLTPEHAVTLALEHDLQLQRDRFGPQIAELGVSAAMTAWTPELSSQFLSAESEAPVTSAIDEGQLLTDRQLSSQLALSQRLPWGATFQVSWDAARLSSSSVFTRYQPELRSGAAVSLEQPLLRGLLFDAARAERGISLQARKMADTDLTAAHAATRRRVLYAYWAWVYARDFLAVQRQSLAMAQALLDGNRTRVTRGAMARVDVIEAEAEVARRAEVILVAEKEVANTEERLRSHILDPLTPSGEIELQPAPGADVKPATEEVAKRALAQRHDLQSLQTSLAIDDINIRLLRNEALPEVALRVNYALRGAGGTELLRADGFPGPVTGTQRRNFSAVLDDLTRTRYPAWSVELGFSYPIGKGRAQVDAARVSLQRRQRVAALQAAEQQVILEANAAVREVEANYERLETSATAVALSERRLDGEQRKFAAGLSTSFFVFQAQRDLSEAREAQLRSLLDYHRASVDVEAVQVIPLERR